MYESTEDQPEFNEKIWRGWVQKGKLRDRAAAATRKKRNVLAGIGLVILAVGSGSAFYLLALR